MTRIRQQQSAGFTLLELIIVIIIVSVIGGILTVVMQEAYESFVTGQQLNNVVNEAQFINERLKIDLSQATPSNITTATSNTFAFTNDQGVSITYNLASNIVTRQEDAGTAYHLTEQMGTVAGDFSFNYYEADGITATATIADIRYINVISTLKRESLAGWDMTVPIHMTIFLRNSP